MGSNRLLLEILVLVCLVSIGSTLSVSDTVYLQDVPTSLPRLPETASNIILWRSSTHNVANTSQYIVQTDAHLYLLTPPSTLTPIELTNITLSSKTEVDVFPSGQGLLLCSEVFQSSGYKCSSCNLNLSARFPLKIIGSCVSTNISAPFSQLNTIAAPYIGTAHGVYRIDETTASFSVVAETQSGVRSIAVSATGLAWATHDELTLENEQTKSLKDGRRSWFVSNWNLIRVTGNTSVGAMIDGNVTSMEFDSAGVLWVGSDMCINILLPDLSWRRLDGYHNQLAFANITGFVPTPTNLEKSQSSATMTEGQNLQMWIATTRGLLRYNYTTRYFHCYNNLRYFHLEAQSTNITSIAPTTDGVIFTTKGAGLALVQRQQYTLAKKAAFMQTKINPRHNRHGLSDPVTLKIFGDVDSWVPSCSDNSGLYTAKYVASQAFRNAYQPSSQTQSDAWVHMQGLQMLHNLTGDTGFFARTYFQWSAGESCVFGRGRWYNSTTMPGWTWKGDTSSDEVVGHFLAYNMGYNYLCTNNEEKNMILGMVTRTLDWILNGGHDKLYPYTFVSPKTSKPTTWARWNPQYVNNNVTSRDDRGEQSFELIAILLVGYRLTGFNRYLEAIHDLSSSLDQYDLNLINSCTQYPYDIVHFDHHLMNLNYLSVIHSFNQMPAHLFEKLPTNLANYVNSSIERLYSFVERENNAMFDSTYIIAKLFCERLQVHRPSVLSLFDANSPYARGESDMMEQLLDRTVQTLRELPLSSVNFPGDNSQRQDVGYSPYNPNELNRALPKNEVPNLNRWADSPYNVRGGSGTQEFTPTIFLGQYWKLKQFGLLV